MSGTGEMSGTGDCGTGETSETGESASRTGDCETSGGAKKRFLFVG